MLSQSYHNYDPTDKYYTPVLSISERCIQGFNILPSDFSLTPVIDKKAYRKGWTEEDRIPNFEIAELLAKGDCTGYGLRSGEASNGLIAIDADGSSTLPIIEALSQGNLPTTVSWTSGKPGRYQLLFQIPDEYREQLKDFNRKVVTEYQGLKTSDKEAVEFRYNGCQSVLPPSKHPDTGEYRWINSPETTKIALLPKEICEYLLSLIAEEKTITLTKTVAAREKTQKVSNSSNDLVNFVINEIYPKLDLEKAFPGFELMGQSGHDLWGSPGYRKSESGKSFSITDKDGYPAYIDFKEGHKGDCIAYRYLLKGGSGYPTGKDYVSIAVTTCNTNRSNLQSRHFQTRIICNYNYTSARINCN